MVRGSGDSVFFRDLLVGNSIREPSLLLDFFEEGRTRNYIIYNISYQVREGRLFRSRQKIVGAIYDPLPK